MTRPCGPASLMLSIHCHDQGKERRGHQTKSYPPSLQFKQCLLVLRTYPLDRNREMMLLHPQDGCLCNFQMLVLRGSRPNPKLQL